MTRPRRARRIAFQRRQVERFALFHPVLEALEDRNMLAAVNWVIDPGASNVNLEFHPDLTVFGYSATIINQDANGAGTGTDWTVGDTAALSGNLTTDYIDGTSIEFLAGSSIDTVAALTAYPDPANFVPYPGTDEFGNYTGVNGGSATASLGGYVKLVAGNLGPISVPGFSLDVTSPAAAISGTDFAASDTSLELLNGIYALNFAGSFLEVPLGFGGILDGFSAAPQVNSSLVGTITVTGPTTRQLTLPFEVQYSILSLFVSGTSTLTGVIVANADLASQVVDRHIFYNNSAYDGNNAAVQSTVVGANNDDGDAIDPSKSALLPGGGPATWSNITGFDEGITGIMIDIDSIPNPAGIDANDFVFKAGNNNTPGSWTAAPAPLAVAVTTDAGTSGSDRITITWTDGAIAKKWLEVQVLANSDTGLAAGLGGVGDIHFWGNAVGGSGDGDSATAAPTNATDISGARLNPHGFGNFALVDDAYDYNKDRNVNATDQSIANTNGTGFGTQLIKINIGTGGPFAPESGAGDSGPSGDSGLSSGLAGGGGSQVPQALPASVADRLDSATSGGGLVASYSTLMEAAGSDDADALDDTDSAGGDALDDDLLDALTAGL
jgi:hypothetical protein